VIDVRAAGTNPADYKIYSGAFSSDPSRLPLRVGMEAAGVVSAVGSTARGQAGPVRVGDEIIAHQIYGAYATQVVVPASVVVPKPPAISFDEAGGLLLAGTTAVHGLSVIAVGSGDTVVVHGASGAVGLMAVNAGARVIGTAGEASHDYLRQLGAEPPTYGERLVDRIRALARGGVDAAGSDEAIDASIALVADHGRIVTIAAPQKGFSHGLKVIVGSSGAEPGTEIRAAARMELVRQAGACKLWVRIAAAYPLREAAAANRELMTGHTHGKIVLIP
jgi:NADPH:quinone reductase